MSTRYCPFCLILRVGSLKMLLCNGCCRIKMPAVHEYWFYVRLRWVVLHYKGQEFLVLFFVFVGGLDLCP